MHATHNNMQNTWVLPSRYKFWCRTYCGISHRFLDPRHSHRYPHMSTLLCYHRCMAILGIWEQYHFCLVFHVHKRAQSHQREFSLPSLLASLCKKKRHSESKNKPAPCADYWTASWELPTVMLSQKTDVNLISHVQSLLCNPIWSNLLTVITSDRSCGRNLERNTMRAFTGTHKSPRFDFMSIKAEVMTEAHLSASRAAAEKQGKSCGISLCVYSSELCWWQKDAFQLTGGTSEHADRKQEGRHFLLPVNHFIQHTVTDEWRWETDFAVLFQESLFQLVYNTNSDFGLSWFY